MYEKHFGLTSKPFPGKATGPSVFLGPQHADIVRGLGKGLAGHDAIVTVTGPVGSGKTTVVNRSLESMAPGRLVAWVGRMQLAETEVLDLLLAGFGIAANAAGRIQRFAAFRRVLAERCATGPRVAIVVEDAQRVGSEALAALESLTADENGDGIAANLVLMGGTSLHELLLTPDLARLRQRIRLRQSMRALSVAEVRGYLKHAIRAAGGDYEQVFDDQAAEKIFECSEGIPRVINAIGDMALSRAADQNEARITPALISAVAAEAFGYEETVTATSEPVARTEVAEPDEAIKPDDEPAGGPEIRVTQEAKTASAAEERDATSANEPFAASVTPIRAAEAVLDPADDAPSIMVESGKYPDTDDSCVMEIDASGRMRSIEQSGEIVADEFEPEETADDGLEADEIPDLIDDTQPALAKLAYADAPGIEQEEPQPENEEPDTIDIPVLSVDEAADPPAVADTPPEGESADSAPDADEELAEKAAEVAMQLELDAALSIELDSTNVMEGLTRDLEHVSTGLRTGSFRRLPDTSADDEDDLPMLSSSMRVHAIPEDDESADEETADLAADAPADSAPADDAGDEEEINAEAGSNDAASDDAEPSDTIDEAAAMEQMLALEETFSRRTNVDVLEAALQEAKTFDYTVMPQVMPSFHEPPAEDEAVPDPVADIPEITLDDALPVPAANEPAPDAEEVAAEKNNAQMERFAEEIGKAHSLEDISDLMAETLFGTEFEQIAAEAVAMTPEGMAELELQLDEPSPVKLDEPAAPSPAQEKPAPRAEPRQNQPKPEPIPVSSPEPQLSTGELLRRAADKKRKPPPLPTGDELKESVALRIEMLNAMKNGTAMPSRSPADPAPAVPAPAAASDSAPPEPIENQIETSLTATLQTLSLAKMQELEEEEDKKEKKSGGLFSRFRKSS